MMQRQICLSCGGFPVFVQALAKDVLHRGVTAGVELKGPAARILQSGVTDFLCHGKNTQAAFIGLFRVMLLAKNGCDYLGALWPNGLSP